MTNAKYESLKENKKIREGIELIFEAIYESYQNHIKQELASAYTNAGMLNVIRAVISIMNDPSDDIKANLSNLIASFGVEKIVTDNNKLDMSADSCQRVLDIYNDPDDPAIITSVNPGYVIKTKNGNFIVQYEDIKINEAHYESPIDLVTKNNDNI